LFIRVKEREILMSISLLAVSLDILSVILSFTISLYLRFEWKLSTIDIEWYMTTLFIILAFDILILYFKGIYDFKFITFFKKIGIIMDGIVYSSFLYIMISYLVKNTYFSRLTFIYFVLFTILLQVVGKIIISYIQINRYRSGKDLSNVLLIGRPSENSLLSLQRLLDKKDFGINVIGYIADGVEEIEGYKRLGNGKEAQSIIDKYNVKAIFITSTVNELNEIVNYCLNKYIKVYAINDGFNFFNFPSEIEIVDDIALTKVKDIYISGAEGKVKRIVDIVLSLLGVIILSPLILIISILIKLDSPGPIIFKHKRLGLNGKIIEVYKFRSMVVNAQEVLQELFAKDPNLKKEFEESFKLKNDPRITRVGAFLRKTSLDEIPQLFNVLKGDLSLVGPRPIVINEIEKYGEYGKYLLRVPPGVTGLWQISGRSDIDYNERVKLDMQYIMNWSLWLDINIIFKTIPAVLKRDGAY
jgi:exopolysaccharide biosynthesis polyprenyl glycosylphosphotransferase